MDDYHKQVIIDNRQHLRELLERQPPFMKEFFRGIENQTASRTRIAYAYDYKLFFDYLLANHSYFKDKKISDLVVTDLEKLTVDDLEQYIDYISYYHNDRDQEQINNERGKSRKIASLRTLYKYFYRKQKIESNISTLIDMPKIHEKVITRLEVDEVARLLDEVESGENLSKKQKEFHKKTKTRDLALLTLLLGTGIRVSECVGLNTTDVDFEVNGLHITRKGGKEVIVYFGEEVEDALRAYMEERKEIIASSGSERALFLSLQHKRISVRSVQKLVKKYSQLVTTLKNISPHKLRSTYGTSLYRETGDIYLVADVLGHKDVNTTKKHYADLEDSRRRQASKVVKLRK